LAEAFADVGKAACAEEEERNQRDDE